MYSALSTSIITHCCVVCVSCCTTGGSPGKKGGIRIDTKVHIMGTDNIMGRLNKLGKHLFL
jgi:hypothetical protein